MQQAKFRAQIRNGWILAVLMAAFVGVWAAYTYVANEPALEPQWDMGHRPFVPGESRYAQPYPIVEADPEPTRSDR